MKPLTPKSLAANTAPNVVGYSRGCVDIRQIGDGEDWVAPAQYRKLAALGPVYRQIFRVQCSVQYPGRQFKNGKPKKVVLCWPGKPQPGLRSKTELPGRPDIANPVWVSCSCNYFRYVCEWALSRYGSSDIIYSNGRPARFTNPRGIGTLCKHIYAALPVAIASWDGEVPEVQSVEEKDVEQIPDMPTVSPSPDLGEGDSSEDEDSSNEEDIRGASTRLAQISHAVRSLALPFDSECC